MECKPAIALTPLALVATVACGPQHHNSAPAWTSVPSDTPYAQQVTDDGYWLQKAGTLAQVSPAAAKVSRYFAGAALGTSAQGTAELVLGVKPNASKVTQLVVNAIAKRAAAKGVTLLESGDLIVLRAKEPGIITHALGGK